MLSVEDATEIVDRIIKERNLKIPPFEKVESAVSEIFENHPSQLEQWKSGNKKIAGWMIGQVHKVFPGVDHKQVIEALKEYQMSMNYLADNSRAKDCCKQKGNLDYADGCGPDDESVKLECKVCGANHYIMMAKNMKLLPSQASPPVDFDPCFTAFVGAEEFVELFSFTDI